MDNERGSWYAARLDRRGFICSSAALCCADGAAPISAAAGSRREKREGTTGKKPEQSPTALVAHCGLYCGACDIYQKRIRACAARKDYATCAECAEMDGCESLDVMAQGYPGFRDSLHAIKRDGIGAWAAAQQREVEKGFRYSDVLAGKQED